MLDINALPDDIARLKRLVAEHHAASQAKDIQLRERDQQIQYLKFQLAKLRRTRFGQSTAKLRSIGREGAGAWTMQEHFAQRFLGRMCRVTVKATVLTSSTSASSGLPRSVIAPAECACPDCGGELKALSLCSKCSANFLRRTGWPLAASAALSALSARSASANAALSSSRVKDYDVTLNTSSLAGTGATLAFDFLAGGGTLSNSVTISDFSTNGTLVSGGVNSGSVSGSLPGTATLTNASFFNELQQGMKLGSTISFQVDLTTNAPTGGSLPDTFSFFLLDSAASSSLTRTSDPTGADSLLTLQITGTKDGSAAAYSGSSPTVPVSIKAATPTTSVPEVSVSGALAALALLLGGLAVIRGKLDIARS